MRSEYVYGDKSCRQILYVYGCKPFKVSQLTITSIIQWSNRIVKSCASIHLRDVVLKKANDKGKIIYPNEIVFSIVRRDRFVFWNTVIFAYIEFF